MGVMESMVPVKNISILQSIEATAQMHIAEIPGPMFAKVISFFRAVYKEHRSEAIVLIFYNEKRRSYKIFPPYQKVSYASVDYNKGISLDGWQMIGTIHSHSSMSAFHSGTDDADEASFDGIHITIGDNDDEEVSISASIVANGTRFLIDPLDYVQDLAITVDIDKTEKTEPTTKYYKMEGGKLVESKTSTIRTYRKLDKRYISTVSDRQKKFNMKWMNMVEYSKPTYAYYGNAAWGGWWGPNYDADAWKNRGKTTPQVVPKGTIIPPQNVGPQKTPGIVFPPHEQEMNPCEDCVFKNHKIDWVMQQLLEEVDGEKVVPDRTDIIPLGMESYVCDQCKSELVIPETQDAICPVCKTDKFLIDTTPYIEDEEEIEYETVGDGEEEIPYKCSNCGKQFFLITQENCPHCGFNILQTEQEAQSYSDMGQTKIDCLHCQVTLWVEDLINDECPFCRAILIPQDESGYLDPVQQALESAAKADKSIQRLPIPDQKLIPINKEPVHHQPYKKGPFEFMKKLAKRARKRKSEN